jgi:putative ABC transport system ATP-binding protein
MATPIIQFTNISRVYGQGETAFYALKDINMAIHPGEFVAIMGASGSGKSTTLNLLGCLDTPTSGRYRFRDQQVEQMSRNERAMLRRFYLGFVFQGFNLLSRTSARENVELPLLYRGESARERKAASIRALEQVGLLPWANNTPGELSGGQQQRVAIARAIVTQPLVLLADEPTGNLDSVRGHEIMELLVTLNRDHGITIAMVTHEPDMAAYASRTIRFKDGHIEEDSSPTHESPSPAPLTPKFPI